MPGTSLQRQRGALMIEILITIAIIIIGLLGLMQVQTQLHKSEVESYQRTQALILLEDMANRIATNRTAAADYVTGTTTGLESPQGAGITCATPATTAPLDERDEAEWCLALQGAAETIGTSSVGALVGGRGCVEPIGTGGVEEYLVTVVWQGLTPIAAPPAGVACGANLYNAPAGSDCADTVDKADFCRRYVTTIVRIADLTDP